MCQMCQNLQTGLQPMPSGFCSGQSIHLPLTTETSSTKKIKLTACCLKAAKKKKNVSLGLVISSKSPLLCSVFIFKPVLVLCSFSTAFLFLWFPDLASYLSWKRRGKDGFEHLPSDCDKQERLIWLRWQADCCSLWQLLTRRGKDLKARGLQE